MKHCTCPAVESTCRAWDGPPCRRTAWFICAVVIGSCLLQSVRAAWAGIPNEATPAGIVTTASADSGTPNVPQLELYIPSFADLVSAARASKTVQLYRAVSGLMPSLESETDEGLDATALVDLLARVADWPDTAVTLTTYTLDRDGRPRWALRVSWAADALVARLQELLDQPAAKQLLKNVALNKHDDVWRLELPDLVLAVIAPSGDGSIIASDASISIPGKVFGIEEASAARQKDRNVPVLYCSLNLDAGDESEKASSVLGSLTGLSNIRYWLTPYDDGRWREDFAVSWNPLLGAALKAVFQKAEKQYDCPKACLFAAVVNLGAITEGMPDSMSGLPVGTLGPHVRGDLALSVVPGTGFLPFPDVYFQFRSAAANFIHDDVRDYIEKDNQKRRDEDQRPAWREEKVDDQTVFWRDPTADSRGGMLSPATYRTVLFVDTRGEGDNAVSHVIIAQTSGWAEDAVRHWKKLTASKQTVKIPSSRKYHWQARLHWKSVYELIQPYLGLAAAFTSGSTMPPEAQELSDSLDDAIIDVNIGLGGVRARHRGPVPLGLVYVPAVTAVSFSSTPDPASEAAREQTAARHLRVLHHHASLFRKDYGRWPANVAELDGYVDFASHPELLRLVEQQKSFGASMAEVLFGAGAATTSSTERDEDAIDDSLYQIQWSAGDDWHLSIREGEFKNFKSIQIDAMGKIHRSPKEAQPAVAVPSIEEAAKVQTPAADQPPADKPAEEVPALPEKKDSPEKKEKPGPRKKPVLL